MVGYPAYEHCPRRRSGLLGYAEYDYASEVYPQQQVPYWVPLSEEEEAEEVAVPVEEYQPPDLSKEEAIRWDIEENERRAR
jgi:hypothetical protein